MGHGSRVVGFGMRQRPLQRIQGGRPDGEGEVPMGLIGGRSVSKVSIPGDEDLDGGEKLQVEGGLIGRGPTAKRSRGGRSYGEPRRAVPEAYTACVFAMLGASALGGRPPGTGAGASAVGTAIDRVDATRFVKSQSKKTRVSLASRQCGFSFGSWGFKDD